MGQGVLGESSHTPATTSPHPITTGLGQGFLTFHSVCPSAVHLRRFPRAAAFCSSVGLSTSAQEGRRKLGPRRLHSHLMVRVS